MRTGTRSIVLVPEELRLTLRMREVLSSAGDAVVEALPFGRLVDVLDADGIGAVIRIFGRLDPMCTCGGAMSFTGIVSVLCVRVRALRWGGARHLPPMFC